jgi:MFS family permease
MLQLIVLQAYNAGAYSPGIPFMMEQWHASQVAVTTGITSFCIGFGIFPMLLAPLSEIHGRYPVFFYTGIGYVAMQIGCALAPNLPAMIILRLLMGGASSVFSTMVGGVISDLYHTHDRNKAMALFSGAALFGTGLGVFISGPVTYHLHWRWAFWLQVITTASCVLAVVLFIKESRGSVILSKRAKALNKWYEQREDFGYYGFDMSSDSSGSTIVAKTAKTSSVRIRWKVKADEDRASLLHSIKLSLYRPAHLLVTEPVVFFFSLWISFAWAVLYLTFGAITLVFQTSRGWNIQQCGFVFGSMCVGALLATILSIVQEPYAARWGNTLNRVLRRPKAKIVSPEDVDGIHKAPYDPEIRLYFTCIQAAMLPIGLFIFGWTQQASIHWIVPCIGVAVATAGIYAVYLATFNYFADVYHRYASSALAAQSCCRNFAGAVLPLVVSPMFNNLGFAEACSLLGGIVSSSSSILNEWTCLLTTHQGALLTLVPWALVIWGPNIRARSKFASEIM